MPRGDRTGPAGQGPMTGRAMGYCAGYAVPGTANRPGYGFGAGWGSGGGHGYRNRFYATGVPFRAYGPPGPGPVLERDEEIALLKSESTRLQSVLETIEQRLQQLETA